MVERSRKKSSIFASAATLYGEVTKPSMASSGICQRIAQAKKPRSRYFTEVSARSSQRGTFGHRRRQRTFSPTHSSAREIVPTGHTHPQKAFRARSAPTRAASRMVSPAGWTWSQYPVSTSRFSPTSALMGRKASTAGGRVAVTGPGAMACV